MKKACHVHPGVLTIILVLALGALAPVAAAVRTRTFVSIAPHAYFVRAIGGDMVDVEILVPSGQSPATYEPSPGQLARLAEADVLFTTGVPFEKRLISKISQEFHRLQIVRIHDGIELRPIDRSVGDDHDHGDAGDPHVWLDPALAVRQAENIAAALMLLRPSDSAKFSGNLEAFKRTIDSVNTELRKILAPVKGKTMYVFHPSFGYFADAFGLSQVAIEHDGKEPSARQLADLIDKAGSDGVGVLFVQPQFSRKQAEAVGQAIGARIVTLDPLSEDYINNLTDMALKIQRALSESDR